MTGSNRVNILLVDDQQAKLLSYEVIRLGENLLKASSATEALEHLLKTEIAVVLLDVCMPGFDGFELAAMSAGVGSDVDDPVGVANDFDLVLDDEHRVSRGLQLIQRGEQRFRIGRMQTRRRLVEHIHDAEQIRANLRSEPQSLQLPG